jgi:hypothetical protein
MFTTALSTIARKWKQFKDASVGEEIFLNVNTMGYYSTTNNKMGISSFGTTWMETEDYYVE